MGVLERGPVRHRGRQRGSTLVADRGPELLTERPEAASQDARIQLGKELRFGRGFMGGVRAQKLLLVEIEALRLRPRVENRGDAGLPVDEGAIAVKTQRFEVGEFHKVSLVNEIQKVPFGVSGFSRLAQPDGRSTARRASRNPRIGGNPSAPSGHLSDVKAVSAPTRHDPPLARSLAPGLDSSSASHEGPLGA